MAVWGLQPGASVGESEYSVAHASLSRVLTRLYSRGLIDIWKNWMRSATAITLTDSGVEEAGRIMREGSNGEDP